MKILLILKGENDTILFTGCRHHRIDMPPGRALQTLDNAVVEGKAKPQTSNKFIWYHRTIKLSYLYYPSICTNMKIHCLLISLTCASIIFCCSAPSSKPPVESPTQSPVAQTRNDMPKMIITSVDESKINVHQLKEKTILILFQPDCDHCQREARAIRENLDAFKEYTLYFISADQMTDVKKFGEAFDLIGQANVHFALTTVEDVIKNFGGVPAPSVYIYTDQKLVQKFNGEVTIDKILQAI